jgi:hypothetical protein
MISFNFNLRNPWGDRFSNLWWRSFKTPFKNKFIELEVYKDSSILSVNFNWSIGQSHAGLDIEAGLFGYCLHFNFYDCRHWDYEKDCYEISN